VNSILNHSRSVELTCLVQPTEGEELEQNAYSLQQLQSFRPIMQYTYEQIHARLVYNDIGL
jgi:hypothetical protein